MLLPLPLATREFGRSRYFAPVMNSTNTEARRQAVENAPNGHLIWADAQRAGKGRLGRRWASPAGMNLYFSLVLRPRRPASDWPQITLTAAVAMVDALAVCLAGAPSPPRIKWPNDIWVGGKKISGILTEADTAAGYVILGIGLNVNMPATAMPPEIASTATSLLIETGRESDRDTLLAACLLSLEQWHHRWESDGFAAIRDAWTERWGMSGWSADIEEPGSPRERVTLIGVDAEGALLAKAADGAQRRIIAGDVMPVA